MVRCFFLLFLLFLVFPFPSVPICSVSGVGCTILMLLEGSFQCQFPFQLTWSFLCHHYFLEMMSSYFSHSLSNDACILGDMFLSSSNTFLCTGTSAGDFRKSSSFCMKGFSKNSLSFSCHFLSGIQFLGISFSSCSMLQISNTSPSLQSFLRKPLHGLLGGVNVCDG